MAQQVPVLSALENGATHILVLMTRRHHEVTRPVREGRYRWDEWIIRFVYGARTAEEYRDRNRRTNDVVRAILARELREKERSVTVEYILRPSTGLHVDRLSTDGELLRGAAQEAQETVINHLRL